MQIDSKVFRGVAETLINNLGCQNAKNYLYQMGYRMGCSYAPKVVPIHVLLAWKTILEQYFLQNGLRDTEIQYEQSPFRARIQFSVNNSDEILLLRPWFLAGWCAGYTNSYLGKEVFFQVRCELLEKSKYYVLESLEASHVKKNLFDVEPYSLTLETRSLSMRICLDRLRDMAYSETPVFLQIEESEQPEYFARYIHQYSERAKQRFIFLEGFAINETLFENALYSAAHSTLFISTIEMIPHQLQEQLVRSLDATSVDHKNIRLIASSEKSLAKLYKELKIIPDLAQLLQNHELQVPVMRMRKEDWIPIAKKTLDYLTPKMEDAKKGKQFSNSLLHFFSQYSWPGGLRELVGVVKSTLMRTKSEEEKILSLEHLPENFFRKDQAKPYWDGVPLRDIERKYIFSTLEAVHGNKREAAKVLQIGYNTLWRKLRLYERKAVTKTKNTIRRKET